MDQQAQSELMAPGSFEFEGRTYQFAAIDSFEVVTRFRKWMIGRALENLAALKELDNKVQYAKAEKQFNDAVAAGEYNWDGPQREKFLQTGEGQKQLLMFAVGMYQPEVTMDLFDRIFDDAEACPRILKVFLETRDPNRGRPASTKTSARK